MAELHTLERVFQRTRSLPVWRVNVLNAGGRGRCIHTEENVNLDEAERAAIEWCNQQDLALSDRSEWIIG